jgi:hypothetical protein
MMHFFENAKSDQESHRHIGSAVIWAVERPERLLVDQGKYEVPKGSGPCGLQCGNPFGGEIHIVVEDGFLLSLAPEQGMALLGDIL